MPSALPPRVLVPSSSPRIHLSLKSLFQQATSSSSRMNWISYVATSLVTLYSCRPGWPYWKWWWMKLKLLLWEEISPLKYISNLLPKSSPSNISSISDSRSSVGGNIIIKSLDILCMDLCGHPSNVMPLQFGAGFWGFGFWGLTWAGVMWCSYVIVEARRQTGSHIHIG